MLFVILINISIDFLNLKLIPITTNINSLFTLKFKTKLTKKKMKKNIPNILNLYFIL